MKRLRGQAFLIDNPKKYRYTLFLATKKEPCKRFQLVEHRGVEPLTSTLRTLRATNCANAPYSLRAGDAAASTDNRYSSTTVCKLQALFLLFFQRCAMTALLPSEIPMNRLTISGLFAPTAAATVFFQLLPAFSIPSGGFDRKYSCRMGYHGLAESRCFCAESGRSR